MENQVNTELILFCPRKTCEYHQSKDNKITKDGVYLTSADLQNRQMFGCRRGTHGVPGSRSYVMGRSRWHL